MSTFWSRAANLHDEGWKITVDSQRMLKLEPPAQDRMVQANSAPFDLITAVAHQSGFAISPVDWRLAAYQLGLIEIDAVRIKNASHDISPLVSHLKKTRIKMLRTLGLNLNDYLDSQNLE